MITVGRAEPVEVDEKADPCGPEPGCGYDE